MKAPKNYYNVVDQKKLGLDQIDKNAAAIAELQELPVLPNVTTSDNYKMLQVKNGVWDTTVAMSTRKLIVTDENASIVSTQNMGVKITKTSGTVTSRAFLSKTTPHSTMVNLIADYCYPVYIKIDAAIYKGVTIDSTSDINAVVFDDNGKAYIANITANDVTISPIGSTRYIYVTISGSDVTLPTGYDYAMIKALVDAGVEVKLIASQAVYHLEKSGAEAVTFAHTAMFSSTKVDYSEIIVRASGSHEYQTVQLSSAS